MTMSDNEDTELLESLDEDEAEREGLFDGQYAAANDQLTDEDD